MSMYVLRLLYVAAEEHAYGGAFLNCGIQYKVVY